MTLAIRTPSALTAGEVGDVTELTRTAEQRDGAPPLSDQARGRLRSGDVVHVLVDDDGALAAYAQRDGESIEVVGRVPDALREALSAAGEQGGAPAEVWAHGKHSPVSAAAEELGYRAVRTLHQLRRSLDPPPELTPLADDVTVRGFVVGQDEAAWLAVNAAAFAEHREQGRMSRGDLDARMAEPWFEPAGFLLAERAGELIGFHWTKQHPGGIGEVYVLGVAPAAQGLHLGPALLTRGLTWLAEQGSSTAMLYVDDDNPAAMRLYERYNFHRFDADVQWRSERFT